jgi:hypothetical protein
MKLKFTTGGRFGQVIPRFSVEEVRRRMGNHPPFNVKMMGPPNESLLTVNGVAEFFEYHFCGQLLAWEYIPCDSLPSGEIISFLQFANAPLIKG